MPSMIDVRSCIPQGGFLHSWLEWARPLRPAESFFLFALLACASAAVNRRILVNPGEEPEVFTNTYTVLIGPSGSVKTTAAKYATRLLKDAVPETPCLPTSYTMEGLCEELHLQCEAAEEGKKKCGGLSFAPEFSKLIGGVDYQLSNLGFLTQLWDSPNYESRKTRTHGLEEFFNPYLVILGLSAPKGIQGVDPNVLDAGGLRRILFVVEQGPKHREVRPKLNSVLFNALGDVFRGRLRPGAFGATMMRLSDEAHALRDTWEEEFLGPTHDTSSEREGYFVACAEAHAMKLAAMVTVLETDHPDRLEVGALRIGHKLVEAIMPRQFEFYRSLVPTAYARLKASMLNLLRQGGGMMKQRAFDRKVGDDTGAEPAEILRAKSGLLTDKRVEVSTDGAHIRLKEE